MTSTRSASGARLERHRTEYAVTLRALEAHLPPAPARVLDCGGGPGRYAIALAQRGYDVTLLDLSAACLRVAQQKAAGAGVTLAGFVQGTATDLACFAAGSFDAVLLMGPLYHLLEEAERQQPLAEAYRVLTPGGVLFAAFIARYAGHRWAARYEPRWVIEAPADAERLLATGQLPPRGEEGSHLCAYMAHPREVTPLLQGAGFEVETVYGVEGLVSMIEDGVNELTGVDWEAWVALNWRVATDPALYGAVEHLLAVGQKPRWRAALRAIAQRLDAAGVTYKVAGGASIALQGVPIPVRDIDIETTAEDAYRFQACFPYRVTEAVALRASDTYRSHFGRFDFDGVMVEVMGDTQRHEAGCWVPTTAATEALVSLDGVPVRVSWLEEEVLAYIRRGRLERAGLCLPHCDRARLLALLRGDEATGVI
ncbi:MAG: methyltransferase domain-containing protein [Anaerolineae bacterium]|nr:methyltransferase domain-containing protein [Anaerolineae bacterium]